MLTIKIMLQGSVSGLQVRKSHKGVKHKLFVSLKKPQIGDNGTVKLEIPGSGSLRNKFQSTLRLKGKIKYIHSTY